MLLVAMLVVLSHTQFQKELTCPLDGTRFKATLDGSGTSFGKYLDLKPYGATAAPWAVAVCPADHFPLYKDDLSADEVEDLKAWVKTAEYRAWSSETSYWLIGKILVHRKAPELDVAHIFLQATWQVEGTDRYRRYADEAVVHFTKALAQMKEHDDAWATAELVCVELERRTELFEAAAKRLERLRAEPQLSEGAGRFAAQQAKLLEQRDSAPHRVE